MKIFKNLTQLQNWRKKQEHSQKTIGFVPTMGALHDGHLLLVKKAKAKCDSVVVSIFVNPTQFNNPDDLKKYPRTIESDLKLLKAAGVSAVFLPTEKMLYKDGYNYKITEDNLSHFLCGAHRPGHFTGVLTVVMKLLNIVRPQQAFFGEKDYQQLQLIQGMAKAFFLDCKIVAVPTLREKSGLALSSRNMRLNLEEKQKAQIISALLRNPKLSKSQVKEQLTQAGFKVDYVEDLGKRRFIAAHIGGVRLIDNAVVATKVATL